MRSVTAAMLFERRAVDVALFGESGPGLGRSRRAERSVGSSIAGEGLGSRNVKPR